MEKKEHRFHHAMKYQPLSTQSIGTTGGTDSDVSGAHVRYGVSDQVGNFSHNRNHGRQEFLGYRFPCCFSCTGRVITTLGILVVCGGVDEVT